MRLLKLKKILKNCLKIEGFGQTSFFPGAPLGKIDITIKKTEWYAPNLGLISYKEKKFPIQRPWGTYTMKK